MTFLSMTLYTRTLTSLLFFGLFMCFILLVLETYNSRIKNKLALNEHKVIKSLSILILCFILIRGLISFINYLSPEMGDRIYYYFYEVGFGILIGTIDIIVTGAVLAIITIIIFRILIKEYNDRERIVTREDTQLIVRNIFESLDFYTALTHVLPKGNKDEDYGLDYIPFMLAELQEKRKRFEKSSNQYLGATIFLSFVFIVTLFLFGYLLLNESSTGTYNELQEVNDELNQNTKLLNELNINLGTNNYFYDNNKELLENLEINSNSETRSDIELFVAKNTFIVDKDIRKFKAKLIEIEELARTERTSKLQSERLNIITTILSKIRTFEKDKEEAIPLILSNQKIITNRLNNITSELRKPSNIQNELLKRLILSLVITTLFLVILRYFKGLYQNHYQEMLKAEEQDLLIRKFYVSLKNSENNSDLRKQVVVNFMKESTSNVEDTKQNLSKVESETLKDIVGAILKKI